MQIKKIKLKDFRNYSYIDIDLDKDTNIFYGDNAQGKTNILEAIYMLATSKSHRKAKDKDMIRFGENEAFLHGSFKNENSSFTIDINLKTKKAKGIAVNKLALTKNNDLMGIANVIVFSPEDLSIIKSSPQKRRSFMDSELCQLSKIYMHNLTMYKKALMQRNILLKELNRTKDNYETLKIWDIQLSRYASEIILAREEFIKSINEIAKIKHKNITAGKEELTIDYVKQVEKDRILEELEQNHKKDIRYMTTSIGPHRDDLSFLINGINAQTYGSQGQQRTVALVLKLSEIELVKKNFNKNPILLLDDVLSELDRKRQGLLLNLVKENQTIITCTGLEEFIENNFNMHKIFRVIDGRVDSCTKEDI